LKYYTCKNFKESLGVEEEREEGDRKIIIPMNGTN
jgi:hypothetical protein